MRLLVSAIVSVLCCASSGLIESTSLPLQTSSYRRQYARIQPTWSTRILEVLTPSKLSCSLLCSENSECKSFCFIVTMKVCQLLNKMPGSPGTSPEHDHLVHVYFARTLVAGIANDTHQCTSEPTGPIRWSRFLLAEQGHRGRVLEVTTHRAELAIQQYGFTRFRGVASMSCIPEGLFIITGKPTMIIFLRFNTDKIATVRTGLYRNLVAVERHNLVFVTDGDEVHRMTTHGRLFRVIAPAGNITFHCLAVDSHNSLLFAIIKTPHIYQVISMNFSGDQIQVLVEERRIRIIAFDVTNKMLVYCDAVSLMGYNVSNATSVQITRVQDCSGITADRGTVYYVDKGTLMMYDGDTEPMSLVKLKSRRWYAFCIIC